MECKNDSHEKEDSPFTEAVSDLMDLQNWEIDDLKKQENKGQEGFEERLRRLKDREKNMCDKGNAFWKDILIDYLSKEQK